MADSTSSHADTGVVSGDGEKNSEKRSCEMVCQSPPYMASSAMTKEEHNASISDTTAKGKSRILPTPCGSGSSGSSVLTAVHPSLSPRTPGFQLSPRPALPSPNFHTPSLLLTSTPRLHSDAGVVLSESTTLSITRTKSAMSDERDSGCRSELVMNTSADSDSGVSLSAFKSLSSIDSPETPSALLSLHSSDCSETDSLNKNVSLEALSESLDKKSNDNQLDNIYPAVDKLSVHKHDSENAVQMAGENTKAEQPQQQRGQGRKDATTEVMKGKRRPQFDERAVDVTVKKSHTTSSEKETELKISKAMGDCQSKASKSKPVSAKKELVSVTPEGDSQLKTRTQDKKSKRHGLPVVTKKIDTASEKIVPDSNKPQTFSSSGATRKTVESQQSQTKVKNESKPPSKPDSASRRRPKRDAKEDCLSPRSTATHAKKGNKSILSPSVLQSVTKVVQDNVRTISTQVVAEAAAKPPNSQPAPTGKPGSKRTQSGSIEKNKNTETLGETGKEAAAPNEKKNKNKSKKKEKRWENNKKGKKGFHESPQGILPEYIPENDIRLNKQSKGDVFHLAKLFSGGLGADREEVRKPKKVWSRPNYFYAVQISNKQIKEGLNKVLDCVEKSTPKLKPAFIPVDTMHITLAVMHLPDQDAIQRAAGVLDKLLWAMVQGKQLQVAAKELEPQSMDVTTACQQQQTVSGIQTTNMDWATTEQQQLTVSETQATNMASAEQQQQKTEEAMNQKEPEAPKSTSSDLILCLDTSEKLTAEADLQQEKDPLQKEDSDLLQPLPIEICGLGHFNDAVVFAKIAESTALDRLANIAEYLRKGLVEEEISIDPKAFAPHATIMKMSKNPMKLKKDGIKKIQKESYASFKETSFGMQDILSVQLCSMMKAKKDGYYFVEHHIACAQQTAPSTTENGAVAESGSAATTTESGFTAATTESESVSAAAKTESGSTATAESLSTATSIAESKLSAANKTYSAVKAEIASSVKAEMDSTAESGSAAATAESLSTATGIGDSESSAANKTDSAVKAEIASSVKAEMDSPASVKAETDSSLKA